MASLAAHFLEMARNNGWASHRLYAACARLDAAELRAPRAAFFGSVLRTLAHLFVVDEFYVGALAGEPVPQPGEDAEDRHPDFERLQAAQAASDRRLVAYCQGLTDAALDATVRLERDRGRIAVERAADVLAHLFQHQIHHRGQVHAMLSGTSVPPPQLDEYFLAEDAPRRAEELRVLGLPVR